LLDTRLSDEDEARIREIMAKYSDNILDYHELRTRKSGNVKYIDFHMTVKEELTVKESHDLSEEIERELESGLKRTNINIHFEPGKAVEIPNTTEKNDQE
jgi:divalent metal cation (Fe/Co/Zn/Cd) transporter